MSTAVKTKPAKQPVSRERKALLAQVHIAKKELGLSDEDYRAVLHSTYGHDSASKLTNHELKSIVGHFKKLGWKGGQKKYKAKSKGYRKPSKRPMVRKIYVLWKILYDNSECESKRPDGFVRRVTKTEKRPDGIAQVEWLDDEEAYAVIEQLKKWIIRVGLGPALRRDERGSEK